MTTPDQDTLEAEHLALTKLSMRLTTGTPEYEENRRKRAAISSALYKLFLEGQEARRRHQTAEQQTAEAVAVFGGPDAEQSQAIKHGYGRRRK